MPGGKMAPKAYKLSAKTLSDGTNLICAAGPDTVLADLVTAPGARLYEAAGVRWVELPATRTNVLCTEVLAEATYAAPEYVSLRRRLMSPSSATLAAWDAVAPETNVPVLAHQREFCAMAFPRRGTFNGSEQGTCKTLTAIMLAKAWDAERTLVVVPKRDLCQQWQDETYAFLTRPPVVVPLLKGTAKERSAMVGHMKAPGGIVLVVTYGVLAAMADALRKWDPNVVVLDEAWNVKNPSAAVTKAAGKVCKFAERVLVMNGTPITQDVGDLHTELSLMLEGSEWVELGDWETWMQRFSKRISMSVGRYSILKPVGVKDPAGMVRLTAPYFFRATKATCLDLPEKLKPVRVKVPLTGAAGDFYRLVKEDGDAVFDPMSLNGDRVRTIRLQQVASGTCPLVRSDNGMELLRGAGWKGKIKNYHGNKVSQVLPSPKRDWCVSWAQTYLVPNSTARAIFWLSFTASIHALVDELCKVLDPDAVFSVTSQTNDKYLENAKASFNSKETGGIQVFVAQSKKFAYGQNLQGCDYNVIYDHPWSYLERDQLEDRSHRQGRVGPVAYWELEAVLEDGKGRQTSTVDAEVLAAFYRRESFAGRFGRDTTREVEG